MFKIYKSNITIKTFDNFISELELKEEFSCGVNVCGGNWGPCGANGCAAHILPCLVHGGAF